MRVGPSRRWVHRLEAVISVEDEKIRRRDELLERIAALSGAASVILVLIGSGFIDHGGKGLDPTQSAEAIGAGFAQLTDEARTGAALMSAATFLGLVFLGPLWTRLQQGATWLAVVAVAGGIAAAALQLVFVMMSLAAMTAGEVGDGQTARTLLILEWETSRAGAAPGLVLVSAATLAGIRYEVFPVGFSALSLLFTVILVIALFPIGPAGLMGSMGTVWIFIASLVMALGRARPSAARRYLIAALVNGTMRCAESSCCCFAVAAGPWGAAGSVLGRLPGSLGNASPSASRCPRPRPAGDGRGV